MSFRLFSLDKILFLTLIASLTSVMAVDSNSNGLSDLWEQRFSVGDILPENDEDGDGYTNLQECIAGTDPYSALSRPVVDAETSDNGLNLSFDSVEGKLYHIDSSETLSSFNAFREGWLGDGTKRILQLTPEGPSTTSSPILCEFWADIDGEAIESLTDHAGFPHTPDGRVNGPVLSAPKLLATGYGARMTALIRPPAAGSYTFYLSAGGPAELYITDMADSASREKVAEILPTQAGIEIGEWTTYPTQRSDLIELTAGGVYFLELCYLSVIPAQHCEVAWGGPSLDGIETIGSDALADVYFFGNYAPPEELLAHDYDQVGQTEAFWVNNTELVPAPGGMTGIAQRVTGDVGNVSQEMVFFAENSSAHLYASWLFHMVRTDNNDRNDDHDDISLIFLDGTGDRQEGPRIQMEESNSGTRAFVRAGGPSGNTEQIEVSFNETYRIELVATVDPSGFSYTTPANERTVSENSFDLYVSDIAGNSIGEMRNQAFRDPDPNDADSMELEGFDAMRLTFSYRPNIMFDNWEVTAGRIEGNGYLQPNYYGTAEETLDRQFYRMHVSEADQDGDGLMDWEELMLGEYYPVLFFDSESSDQPDTTTVETILSEATGLPHFSLFASDAAAFESNYPNTIPDDGEITITREGSLTPMAVPLCILPLENTGDVNTICDGTCCTLIGSAGDELAEIADYQLIDEDGAIITDTIYFEFGELTKKLRVIAVNDTINEYPETLNIALAEPTTADYTISELLNGASIQLFDLPDNPDNITIFTGTFSRDGNAVTATGGSGFVTATINGPRTQMHFWDEFSNLTSNQQDSHIHKSNTGPGGNNPGSIIYSITETPGDETTDPLNGPLVNYPWDLTVSSGTVPTSGGSASKQAIIDSLFGQNGETPLYLNVHTVDNPAGEIWAFLSISGGSATPPEAPAPPAAPGSAEYPQLTGALLDADVRRFLNQATFGTTETEVSDLLSKIETARITDPDYHRHTAFSEWIDEQTDLAETGQTYLLDYTLAAHYQFMTLSHIFDPVLNPSNTDYTTPTRPSEWPTIDRSNANPALWHLSDPYPVIRDDFRLSSANSLITEPRNNERRHAHWQVMLNGKDQLRQKMGYALQQIVVVSASLSSVSNNPYGSANYQDLINTYAFSHYRDILGFVNWSPLMGKWLSSLQNQRAIDFDGDGLFDAYPDENLARENMQLFSIGLFQQWPDGTLKLSSEGLPLATYTNDDIREFAKILTGQSFSRYNGFNDPWGGSAYVADNNSFGASQNTSGILSQGYSYPMKMFGDYHEPGVKAFAGVTIDNTHITDPTLQGIADIEAAIDWLAGNYINGLPDYDMVNSHVSTPAFISKRLIQRFTTSNPSRDYLHRVATQFKDSSGNLELTLRAILLDPEARRIDLDDTVFGLKKSPLEGYIQLLRSLDAHTHIPLTEPADEAEYADAPGDFTNPDLYLENYSYPSEQLEQHSRNVRFVPRTAYSSGSRGLQMDPFRQETVFNYYLSDYSPGGIVGNAGLVAPELQLANEPDIVRNINFFEDIIRSSRGPSGDALGRSTRNQLLAFGSTDPDSTEDQVISRNDDQRLARQSLADALYPSLEPDPGDSGRTPESIADEALVDALDLRLTNGLFKLRYPYDPTDDDSPDVAGVDDLLKNPRELIIDAITNGYSNPFDLNNDASDRLNKFSDALYLLTFSPEFQIKK